MEKIWNGGKPEAEKMLSVRSVINVVHFSMMHEIMMNDLMYI